MQTIKGKLLFWNGLLLIGSLILLEIIAYAAVKSILYHQVDANLANESMEIAGLIQIENNEVRITSNHEWNEREHQAVGADAIYLQITTYPKGKVIQSSNLQTLGVIFSLPKRDWRSTGNNILFRNFNMKNLQFRTCHYPVFLDEKLVAVLTTASSLMKVNGFLSAVRNAFLIVTPLFGLLSLLGMWILSKNALKPLQKITETAEHTLQSKNLKQKIEVKKPDREVARLIDTLNELFFQLDKSIEQMKSFTANASHELRTPLTIIRGNIDVILSRERSPKQYRETLLIILEEVKKLSKLVDNLLILAKGEAQPEKLSMSVIRLDNLIRQNLSEWQQLISEKSIETHLEIQGKPEIIGNDGWIREMMTNLIENAVKYNHPEGNITIRLRSTEKHVVLEVADSGIGIPEGEREKVFERFFRGNNSLPHSTEGSGLGLAIVKWIVEAHRGQITVTSTPGKGAVFHIKFPKAKDKKRTMASGEMVLD